MHSYIDIVVSIVVTREMLSTQCVLYSLYFPIYWIKIIKYINLISHFVGLILKLVRLFIIGTNETYLNFILNKRMYATSMYNCAIK